MKNGRPLTRSKEHGGPSRSSLRQFWPYVRGHKGALLVVAVVSLLTTALAVAQPLLVQLLVNSVSVGENGTLFLWMLVGVTLAEALFSAIQSFLLQRTAESVILGLRRSLIGKMLTLPIREFDQRRVGDLMSRVGSDTTLMRGVITSGLFQIISSVLMFLAAVVLMIMLDTLLFAITFTAVLTGAGLVVLISKLIRRISMETQEAVGAMSSAVERGLSGIRTIKASVAEAREAEIIDVKSVSAYTSGIRMAKLQATVQPVMSIFIQGAFVLVLAVGGVRVADGQMMLGDLMGFILYLFLLITPVSAALTAFVQIQAGLAALDRVREITELSSEAADEEATTAMVRTASSGTPALEFERVRFAYSHESGSVEDEILRGVSFSVRTGGRTAIVGQSGSGKSTVLALAERFYELDGGSIKLFGQDIRSIQRKDLRAELSLLEQDAPVLSGTLAENLRLSAPQVSETAMLQALVDVGLEDLASRSSEGLHQDLGEDGVRMSGGQRQRLGWARLLVSGHKILLMDEPTSAVDAKTEALLVEVLRRLPESSTVIMVAHRLSTIVDFDQILVMDSGRVVEAGTHMELMQKGGIYAEMAKRQKLGQVAEAV